MVITSTSKHGRYSLGLGVLCSVRIAHCALQYNTSMVLYGLELESELSSKFNVLGYAHGGARASPSLHSSLVVGEEPRNHGTTHPPGMPDG